MAGKQAQRREPVTLDRLITAVQQQVAEVVARDGLLATPILLAHVGCNVVVCELRAPGARPTDLLAPALRRLGADAYIFIWPAWGTITTDPERQRVLLSGESSVRDLPPDDCDDVVMVTAAHRGGTVQAFWAAIAETPTGRFLRAFESLGDDVRGAAAVSQW